MYRFILSIYGLSVAKDLWTLTTSALDLCGFILFIWFSRFNETVLDLTYCSLSCAENGGFLSYR